MRSPSVTRVSNRLGASSDMALKQPSAASAVEISSGSTPRAVRRLGPRRGPAEVLGQLRLGGGHGPAQLLDPPGRPDAPAVVAEVPLDLTGDGGHGVGQEPGPLADLEPVDGLDQAEQGHLLEVVGVDATAAVAVGDGEGRAAVEQDDLVPQRWRSAGSAWTASSSSCCVRSSRSWASWWWGWGGRSPTAVGGTTWHGHSVRWNESGASSGPRAGYSNTNPGKGATTPRVAEHVPRPRRAGRWPPRPRAGRPPAGPLVDDREAAAPACVAISCSARSMQSSASTATSMPAVSSPAVVAQGSAPSATQPTTMSRSVMTPVSRCPSAHTGSEKTARSRIVLAATTRVSVSRMLTGSTVMRSRAVVIRAPPVG